MRENQAEWRQSRLEVRDAAFMKVSEKVFPERAHVNSCRVRGTEPRLFDGLCCDSAACQKV